MRRFASLASNFDCSNFSTPSTTPSLTRTPTAVLPPACELSRYRANAYPLLSTAFCAYSTWKTRPSGEYVDALKSYYYQLYTKMLGSRTPVPIEVMLKSKFSKEIMLTDFNRQLSTSKQFRNPATLYHLMNHLNLDPYASLLSDTDLLPNMEGRFFDQLGNF